MGKRVLSVLLAVVMLLTMDGASLSAMGSSGEFQQRAQKESSAAKGEEQKSEKSFNSLPKEGQEEPGGLESPSGEEDLKDPGTSDPSSGEEDPKDPGTSDPSPGEEDPKDPGTSDPSPGEEDPPKKQYTISFQLAGGITAEGEESFSIQVPEGEIPDTGKILEVKKKGYQFKGWQDENGDYYAFNQPVTEDLTLLAAWTPITYRIQFDLDGGTGGEISEQTVFYDQEIILPTNTSKKPGYVPEGWEQEGVGVYQEQAPVKNLTDVDGALVVLKAVWRKGQYKVRFNANGGKGSMKDEVYTCGQKKSLFKNKFTKSGYTFAGWNTRKDGKGQSFADKEKAQSLSMEDGSIVVLYAMWQGNPYTVKYSGNGANSGSVPSTSHIYGTTRQLGVNQFKRKGYTFAGWNTKADGTGKTYQNGAQVKNLTTQLYGSVTLYAKWTPVTYKIIYDLRGGKLPGSARRTYNITTSTFSLPAPSRKGYDFDGWYKDAKLKSRVSELKQGNTGDKKFYAKWVKCTRSPKKNSAKMTVCKATGTGKVKVSATVKNRIASDDDCYYLVYVSPTNGNPYRMAAKSYKKKKLGFNLKTSENQGYVTAKYGIAVKKKGKYKLISSASFVKNPEKAAKNKSKYKLGKTKKGMQFYNTMQEIEDCGAKNNFLNITVSMVCGGTVPYNYNGKTYYFSSLDSYKEIISECNKKGINVTMQIMLDWFPGHTDLIAGHARVNGAAPYYSWNVYSNSSREKMEAIFCYLGNIFGKKSCYVSNWVLGNEINNPKSWNYKGNMSDYSYFRAYAFAFRSLYYSIRSQYSNARIFICTDNFWNTSVSGGYSAKYVITSFTRHLGKIQKGLKWNLAYHAYSAPLTYTNFWDGYGITNDANSPYITMKNLHVLTDYIKKKYGSSVRVILSEQGYSSSWGQANQAAAIAYSYYIAACNPMVDAFIIRSYYDHPIEVAQGLRMGIKGKEAFTVFKYMDTSKSFRYTNRYLKLMGAKSWKSQVRGYHKSRITKTYTKK